MRGDSTPHPWRELRGLTHLTVHSAELAAGIWGLTAGNRIWLATGLSQAERRGTLAHELEHHERGHRGCQPPGVETDVAQAAARRLIPFEGPARRTAVGAQHGRAG